MNKKGVFIILGIVIVGIFLLLFILKPFNGNNNINNIEGNSQNDMDRKDQHQNSTGNNNSENVSEESEKESTIKAIRPGVYDLSMNGELSIDFQYTNIDKEEYKWAYAGREYYKNGQLINRGIGVKSLVDNEGLINFTFGQIINNKRESGVYFEGNGANAELSWPSTINATAYVDDNTNNIEKNKEIILGFIVLSNKKNNLSESHISFNEEEILHRFSEDTVYLLKCKFTNKD